MSGTTVGKLPAARGAELFCWRAATRSELRDGLSVMRTVLDAGAPLEAACLRSAEQFAGAAGPHVLAIVAADADELAARMARATTELEGARETIDTDGVYYRVQAPAPRIALLFAGQGAQALDMLRGVASFPGARQWWDRADGILAEFLQKPLTAYVYPPADVGSEREERLAELTATEVAQPAIGVVDTMVFDCLEELGLVPAMAGGHSYGEFPALAAAGVFGFEDLVRISAVRGRAVAHAAQRRSGSMVAVAADEVGTSKVVARVSGAVVANVNGPSQTVVSGPRASMDEVVAVCRRQGIRARAINVSAAFHSPLMEDAVQPLREVLDRTTLHPPRFDVFSNVTGQPYPSEPSLIRNQLLDHLTSPVRYMDCVRGMHRAGARIFVEVGPGRIQSGLVDSILGRDGRFELAVEPPRRDDVAGFLDLVARLIVSGVPLSPRRLLLMRGCGHGHRVERRMEDGRARTVPPQAIAAVAAGVADGRPPGAADAAMVAYLESMELVATSQMKVMLGYLRSRGIAGEERAKAAGVPEASPMAVSGADRAPSAAESETPPGGPAARGVAGVEGTLLEVAAGLTGYPVEAIDVAANLDEDLGIDSIKRVEIATAVLAELDMEVGGDIAELAEQKTLTGMLEFLANCGEANRPAPQVPPGAERTAASDGVRCVAPLRQAVELAERRVRETVAPEAGTVTVVVGAPAQVDLCGLVADRLARYGRTATVILDGECDDEVAATARYAEKLDEVEADGGKVGGVVYLAALALGAVEAAAGMRGALREARRDLRNLFGLMKAFGPRAAGREARIVLATRVGDGFACGGTAGRAAFHPGVGGHLGFVKSVAQEIPNAVCRAVDLDPALAWSDGAALVADEYLAPGDEREVAFVGGRRHVLATRESPPAGADGQELVRGTDVLLITGGGRGITAEVAVAIASEWRPTIVVLGRTPLADGGSEASAAGGDASARESTAGTDEGSRGGAGPAHAQVLRNLRRMRDAGASAHYMAVDVCDPSRLGAVVEEVECRFGRIRGIVHGAGVVEDALLRDKDWESFERVMDTKISPVEVLVDKVDPAQLRFLAFFSSTAARYGNRGQCDYASANETLNKVAVWLNGIWPAHVISALWGPWEPGTGMVGPALGRYFESRGIRVISRSDAVAAFVRELRGHRKQDVEVVFA